MPPATAPGRVLWLSGIPNCSLTKSFASCRFASRTRTRAASRSACATSSRCVRSTTQLLFFMHASMYCGPVVGTSSSRSWLFRSAQRSRVQLRRHDWRHARARPREAQGGPCCGPVTRLRWFPGSLCACCVLATALTALSTPARCSGQGPRGIREGGRGAQDGSAGGAAQARRVLGACVLWGCCAGLSVAPVSFWLVLSGMWDLPWWLAGAFFAELTALLPQRPSWATWSRTRRACSNSPTFRSVRPSCLFVFYFEPPPLELACAASRRSRGLACVASQCCLFV